MAQGASRPATFAGNFGGKRFPLRDVSRPFKNTDPIWFAALYLVISLLYVSSMDSDIGFWDTGEMQTIPYILGLAHPNGFPTEILLGWVFSHTVVFGSPAFRLTLLSTLCSAASPAIAFLIARKLGARRMTAFFCSILFAMTRIVWNHGTRVDVIDMAVMFASLAMLFSLVTATDQVDWKLFAAAFGSGAALGTHLAVVFYLPACFAFLAFRSSSSSVVKRLTIFVVVSVCCAILIYSYMPIRSFFVERSLLDPTASIGLGIAQPIWDWGGPSNLPRFIAVVTGSSVGAGHAFAGFVDLKAYIPYLVHAGRVLLDAYPALIVVPTAYVLFRRFDRQVAILLIPFFLTAPFAVSFNAESDSDRYFIFPILCLW